MCDRDGFRCPCGTVSRLEVDPGDVLAALPLFESVLSQTWNRAASIVQIGAYASVSRPGTAFSVDPRLITLRADAAAVESLVMTRAEGADGSWLHLLGPGAAGNPAVTHRFRPLGDLDHVVLASFGEGGAAAGRLLEAELPAPIPFSFDGSSFEGASFEGADQLGRLDAVITGRVLPALGARTVELDVVAAVLEHVCSIGLPIGVGVHSPGAVQVGHGFVQSAAYENGRLVVALDRAVVELDLAEVGQGRLVRTHAAHGPTSSLEVLDTDGRTVAVISEFGIVGSDVHACWEDVAASLPTTAS